MASRLNTGGAWWKKTGNGRVVLLGYNAPTVSGGVVQALNIYEQKMNEMRSKGVPDAQIQQYAWLATNLATSAQAPKNPNACAWDESHYYFISYYPPLERLAQISLGIERDPVMEVFGAFRVPISSGENLSTKPTVPKTRGPGEGSDETGTRPGGVTRVLEIPVE